MSPHSAAGFQPRRIRSTVRVIALGFAVASGRGEASTAGPQAPDSLTSAVIDLAVATDADPFALPRALIR